MVFNTIDRFLALGAHSRASKKLLTSGNVDETDVVERGMAFGFHGIYPCMGWARSALTSFKTRLNFVDDVDATLPANHLAGWMALLGGLDGRDNFHGKEKKTPSCGTPVNVFTKKLLKGVFKELFSEPTSCGVDHRKFLVFLGNP